MSGRRSIRDDFAELLTSEDRREIVAALKGFVSAGKLARFVCERCGAPNHVQVPDSKVRLDTLRFMSEQGLGRLLAEDRQQSASEVLRRSLADVASLSDEDLALIACGGGSGDEA